MMKYQCPCCGYFTYNVPANAPPEHADRNTLWSAAEAVEKQWNFQLARRWVLTIPREIPPDQYAVLVREFCEQQFVSKGMIVDFAIHAPIRRDTIPTLMFCSL